jgi:bifunctional non-homologous end joining protein LigD
MAKSVSSKSNESEASEVEKLKDQLAHLPKSEMPSRVSPMLASPTTEPFDDDEWIFEDKLDGYRAVAFSNNGKVGLRSKEGKDYYTQYPPIVQALKDLKEDVVLDGELVVLDKKGHPDFGAMERWDRYSDEEISYYVFDLIWFDGHDLKDIPLIYRKELLRLLIPENSIIRYVDYVEGTGIELYNEIKKKDLEGIVAKKKDSIYLVGKRSLTWKKITVRQIAKFVFGGWVEADRGTGFKSLLFGFYDNGDLIYYHHCGHGWTEKQMREMYAMFKTIETDENPFVNEVNYPGNIHWMKPIVGEIKVSRISKAGKIRHSHPAILEGWCAGCRTDKRNF